MAGEFFQSERTQISGVEAQATKEKKTDVASAIQKKKDLFQGEVSKAGKMLADADSKATVQASKDKVAAYKSDITGTLKNIVEKGQNALKAENPSSELSAIESLADALKSTTEKVKLYVPLFSDVEEAKGFIPKIEEKLKVAREAKKKSGIGSQIFNKALMDVDDVMLKAKESKIYLWIPDALPADMRAILNSVLMPLKEQDAESAGYRLERTQDSALADSDDEKELSSDDDKTKEWKEGMREGKVMMRKLKAVRASFEGAQPQMKKISDALKEAKGDSTKVAGLSDDTDKAITDLAKTLKDLKAINPEKITDPSYRELYDNLLGKTQLQLRELGDVKLSIKTNEFITKGLTEEEKKYVKVDEKGNLIKTEDFNKLPKDRQKAFEAKFKLVEIQVGMELDEKTSSEKDKSMVEGRKKMLKGDIFGGKEDLLKYYNTAEKDPDYDPVRFEQCKEMLKQIAMMELEQMDQRLAAMKESVKSKYNYNIGTKTDFGTWTYDQAIENIDNMARVIYEAHRMIEKGDVVTIEAAEAKLRQMKKPLNSGEDIDFLKSEKDDIQKKNGEQLQKDKDETLKRLKNDVETQKEILQSLINRNPNSFAVIFRVQDHGEITEEDIQKQRDLIKKAEEGLTQAEGLTLEGVRQGQLNGIEARIRKQQLYKALDQWQAGFPVDINSNAQEVFDMFSQQRKLNVADPEKRKENTLDEARKARERGFTGLARSLYESYFADELKIGAKDVDKEKVRKDTLGKPDNIKRISKAVDTWKDNYRKQMRRNPTEDEIAEAKGKMENMVVGEAYNKEVKLSTYKFMKDQVGAEGNEWRKVYGGTVAIEDFGQGGPFTAFWTDEQWNALPVKVGVMTSVTIASAGIASGAVTVGGMGARLVLGDAFVTGLVGTVGETGAIVGGSTAGRLVAFAGESALEGTVFAASQYELNGLIMGYDYERFSGEYWEAIGHSILTMGTLKGIGMGVGKLKNLAEAAGNAKYLEGGLVTESAAISGSALKMYGGGSVIGGAFESGAWWAGKTSLEGGGLVGLDVGTSFLAGRHFTLKEGIASFGSNFVYSGLIGGVHEFMGSGHEGPTEKKTQIPEEIQTGEAIGKAAKAHIEVDVARAKIEKAREEGKPTEKLESDLKKKQEQAKEADTKMAEAEKKEGETRKENLEKTKKDLEAKLADQQKDGKVDPILVAQLKITEALLGAIKGANEAGAERTPGGVKIDIETLGIFQKYTNALLSNDTTTLSDLRSLYPKHIEMFNVLETQAKKIKTTRDAVALLVVAEVSTKIEGKDLNTVEDIDQFVSDYNAKNKPLAEGEPQVVGRLPGGKGVLIIDRNGKLQYLSKTAADTHFYSVFSKGVSESELEKTGGKESKDIPAWIDTDGRIHYNSEYFEAKYGVEMKQVQGKDGNPVNVFVVDGVEMGAKEFFKTNPKGKEVLAEMKQKKDHEVTHRLLEAAILESNGALGKALEAAVTIDPEIAKALLDSAGPNGTINAKSIQEFLCQIADGTVGPNGKIKLTAEQVRALQDVIGKDLPGFSFNKVRIMDTQLLGFKSPKDLTRSSVDFFSSDSAKMYEKKMSELEFTERLQGLVTSMREGKITKEEYMKSVVEEIMLKTEPKKLAGDLMDLMGYDVFHRADSPYGEYFKPELIEKTVEKMEMLNDAEKVQYKKILTDMSASIREKLLPYYQKQAVEFIKSKLAQIPAKGLNREKLTKFLEENGISELAKRYEIELPFLNKDYSINQEYIQKSYEGVKEKSNYADIEALLSGEHPESFFGGSKTSFPSNQPVFLSLNTVQKAKIKEYLDGSTDKLTMEDLGVDGRTYGAIKKLLTRTIEEPRKPEKIHEEFTKALEAIAEKNKDAIKPEDRAKLYDTILEDLAAKGTDITTLNRVMLDYLRTQNEMGGPDTRAADAQKFKKGLEDYREKFQKMLKDSGIENPNIFPLLGDGEPLAIIEWVKDPNQAVNLVYVSRKTMMTEAEYAQYMADIRDNPALADSGKRLDSALVYSTIYNNRNGKVYGPELTKLGISEDVQGKLFKSGENEIYKFKAKTAEELVASQDYQNLSPENKKKVMDLYEKANKDCVFNEAFAATKEYKKMLTENKVDPAQIENLTQVKFLTEFTDRIAKARESDPEFKAKTDQIYKEQIEPYIKAGQTPVFVDSGMKGTIPSLMASLVKIHNAQKAGMDIDSYMSANPNDVRIFVHSVDPVYAEVIPHFSVGRSEGKPIEDAGKFGRLDYQNNQIKISSAGPKSYYLAALDFSGLF